MTSRTYDDLALRTEVRPLASLAELPPDARWNLVSSALSPQWLRSASDARWTVSAVLASVGEAVVGVLPLHRCKGAEFPAPVFDPHALAPGLFAAAPADEWLLVGGTLDLVSGVALAADLPPALSAAVGRALVDRAFEQAAAQSLLPAALYVRDEQVAAFLGRPETPVTSETPDASAIPEKPEASTPARTLEGAEPPAASSQPTEAPDSVLTHGRRKAAVLDRLATVHLAGGDHLSGLDHGRRSVVRRDLRRIRDHGLTGACVPAADLVAEAAALVAEVKLRHGVPDHPRLAALRLRAWAAAPVGRRVGFAVRDAGGALLAACFGCHHGQELELTEIGLADHPEHRHLAYVEALFYAPLRYAERLGCTTIRMGLGSSRPKDLRGATFSPVWAVGEVNGEDEHAVRV